MSARGRCGGRAGEGFDIDRIGAIAAGDMKTSDCVGLVDFLIAHEGEQFRSCPAIAQAHIGGMKTANGLVMVDAMREPRRAWILYFDQGKAIAIGAIVLSLRRDREVGFMVTLIASLLLSPLLWDHYLAMLLLPAAFLAGRGRPWGMLLPLAAWLPVIVEGWTWLYPAVVIVALLLP